MNFRKNSKGITLIALVVTIIVLLILAGVSLSLVAGSNGILEKARKSADTSKVGSAKEQVELKIAEYQTEFYESVYVNREEDVNKKMGDWIAKKKTGNIKTEEYTFEITGSTAPYTVTIKKDNTLKADIVGSLSVDGILSWTSSGSTTGGSTPTETLSSLGISNTNIGDYIDLGNNIVGESATTDDWRILYVDSETNKVYAILADYLPNASIPAGETADQISKAGYSVWSDNNRASLLDNYINDGSKWSSLANGISGATVTGSPTKKLIENSYTAKNGSSWSSSVAKTQDLYVPHTSGVTADSQDTYGYWLASPYADITLDVWIVGCSGNVIINFCNDDRFGVRPVVCLPSDIPASKDGNVWVVEQ